MEMCSDSGAWRSVLNIPLCVCFSAQKTVQYGGAVTASLQTNPGIARSVAIATCSHRSLAFPSSNMLGVWEASLQGSGLSQLSSTIHRVHAITPVRAQPRMGPGASKDGVFAPLVVVARNIVGTKRFNQLRGKAIAVHSQVITEFCKQIGADAKQRQGLIRLAKKNGEKLGFLA
eukprot:TRINITY_DN7946_c0_g1_i1.p1 TRINITY_DN7946_c0_g1~~TRINITY_DN7946_c0_g1_i1.p1  ORF type:complete len:174 (+),score=4.02 TRINITY_DN7946_c0_g1_i1:13-534(+)